MDFGKWTDRYSVDCRLKYQSEATCKNYISSVKMFLEHFKTYGQPKEVPTQKIKEWLLSAQCSNTRNQKLSAIKSFYQLTVGMPAKINQIPYSRKEQKLPMPLSVDEIEKIVDTCDNRKHLAIISLLFGCGMRVGEVLNLKPGQIDRSRGVIHVINGKGAKDRYVPMGEQVLKILEDYWREYLPKIWMFNGQFSTDEKPTQYTLSSINAFLKQIAKKAGIRKNVHSHLGRHSYATNQVENGIDLGLIQNILGHKNQKTTLIYAKISSTRISQVKSPLSRINQDLLKKHHEQNI
ncbi:MAG: tyrosine-type recombinase/integrase [Chitinophagaceae bacterium]|nr:tyrosine-type recombinase/integrase [Chitinophagaceae bacterium]